MAAPASLVTQDGLVYQTGLGNSFESEALAGALPKSRNNPRRVPYNLYTEQLSGTAFTSPRHLNRRTWLYRIQPSVVADDYCECGTGVDDRFAPNKYPTYFGGVNPQDFILNPSPLRWKPMPEPSSTKCDFVNGLVTLLHSGDPLVKDGLAVSMYCCNASMENVHLYNADGDFLIVPQHGSLRIETEMGLLRLHPKEICVIPRGIVFSVHLEKEETFARGYVLEVFKGHFSVPELGPIGSNGLANVRDFLHPTAWYVSSKSDYNKECTILSKFGSKLFARHSKHSPYNVVAWHGNYVPFKYNLDKFCAVNSVTYDHLDPSIYTVLTCVGNEPGTALADFVIFPPRVMATDDNTLRPPWFHRNTMSEFMGLISGKYDAKEGFIEGGASLHSTMTPHGPDSSTYGKAIEEDCSEPTKFEGGLAFMFETSCLFKISPYALKCGFRDVKYNECWQHLEASFTGWKLSDEEQEPKTDRDTHPLASV